MRNRSKLILTTAALAVSCVLLSGCGGSSSTASSAASSAASPAASAPASSAAADSAENGSSDALADAVNTLLEADPISNQFEIDPIAIEYDFGMAADDVESYKGVKSNDNGDAGLVIVVKPAEGKMQNVLDALDSYKQMMIDTCSNYPADFAQALENANNAIIANNDELAVMVIASNECTTDLTSAVNSVLGK